MLGFGAAGTYLSCKKSDINFIDNSEFISKMASLLALTTIIAVCFIPRINFCPIDVPFSKDPSNLLSLLAIIILTCGPFFFGGICIAHIISTAGKYINHVYFADLAGAAIGCLLAILIINTLGAVASCFAVAAIALVVTIIAGKRRHIFKSVMLIIVIGVTIFTGVKEPLRLYVPRQKQMFLKEHLVERVDWNIITRLDITRPVDLYYSFGGALSTKYQGPPQKSRIIYQDGTALTGIVQPNSTIKQTPSLPYYLQAAPYKITSDANALVIGCGGGIDILIALDNDAKHVVGVDINPDTIKLLYEYDDFALGTFTRDDVELVAAEGRHFLSRDQRKFDVIQLSGVDTFSALATGAYSLSENFIYTTEAFEQYFLHLTNNGIVNISYPLFKPLKMAAMWSEVLARMELENPENHILILSGHGQHYIKDEESYQKSEAPWAQTMVKRSPFTPEQVHILTQWANSLDFEVIYDPHTRRESKMERIIRASDQERKNIICNSEYNIELATDDKPFYFRFSRWDRIIQNLIKGKGFRPSMALAILGGSLSIVTVLGAGLILYPLCQHSNISTTNKGGRAGIFIYFSALGLAFILIEIALMQKLTIFLGGPGYSMSITLFTILLASGAGSFLSRNWSSQPFKLLRIIIPSLIIAVALEVLIFNRVLPHLMFLSHPFRAVATILIVAPLALLMGIPFPTGLRHVDTFRPELNPWAWGVNALATVTGAIICIFISSFSGFNSVLVVGAAIYLIGWLIFTTTQTGTIKKF